jgi:hypothetical protein
MDYLAFYGKFDAKNRAHILATQKICAFDFLSFGFYLSLRRISLSSLPGLDCVAVRFFSGR